MSASAPGTTLALAAIAWSGSARGAPSLDWDAPSECPTAQEVLASFARMHADGARDSRFDAVARVTREDDAYVLRMSLHARDGASEVRYSARQCDTLADVAALELALTTDAPAIVASLESPKREPAARSPAVVASVAGGATAGALPGVAGGARVAVALDTAGVRLALNLRYFAPESASYGGVPGGPGGRFDRASSALRACSSPGSRRLGVGACAGFEGGFVHAAGFGLEPSFSSFAFWGAVTAAPFVRWAFTPGLALFGEGEVEVSVARPEFHARNLGTLFRPDPVGGTVWIGVEASL